MSCLLGRQHGHADRGLGVCEDEEKDPLASSWMDQAMLHVEEACILLDGLPEDSLEEAWSQAEVGLEG